MAEYGSRLTKNRTKPGGDLGSKQYFYTVNKKTGDITVTRIEKSHDKRSDVTVGTIMKGGGKFVPSSNANIAEKKYYNSNIGSVRSQSLQMVRKEWDGREKPNPNTLIYGADALNKAYNAPGTATPNNSLKDSSISPRSSKRKPRNSRKGGGSGALVYPVALRESSQDFVKIEKLAYAPKQRDSGDASGWGKRNPNRQSVGSPIILPIPGGITSTDTVGWGGDKMDPAATAMANIALTGVTQGLGAGVDELQAATQTAVGNPETRKALSTAIAGSASGTGAQLLQRTEGAIINPNMELLFKDPGLRDFNFTWKFAPRNSKEAQTVIKIIRFFKQGMAVQKSESNLFLKAPHTWRLAYKHKGQDHKYLNKFKECAMQSFTTQYTPDGNYATFETGHMVSYSITMSLQELDPVFAGDYDNVDGIGY